jgi:hypothetical protein
LGHTLAKKTREENPRTLQNLLLERRSEARRPADQYYDIEFFMDGTDVTDRFRIWYMTPDSMGLLIKENSDILPRLKVGETLNMKAYTLDLGSPSEYLVTAIRHITRKEQTRLRGHYLIRLETLRR